MGNEHSDEKAKDKKSLHPRFEKITFLKENQIMQATINLSNIVDFETWEDSLSKVAKFDDEVILLPKAYCCTRKAVCGSSAVLEIQYDNYPYLLQSELENRFQLKKHFSEEEIWYLLFSLVKAATDFKSINKKIGDVRPKNIFLNDNGQIRISNLFSWPCQTTNFEKTFLDQEVTFLAPEQIDGTKEGKTEIFIDKFIAESFSIGLTVLETALLQRCSTPYNLKLNTFDRYELSKLLKKWWDLAIEQTDQESGLKKKIKYSEGLKLVVAAMCDLDPEERLTSEQVSEWLTPFQDQIQSLQKFDPGVPEVKNLNKYEIYLFMNSLISTPQIPQSRRQMIQSSATKNIVINGKKITFNQPSYPTPISQPLNTPKVSSIKDYGLMMGSNASISLASPKPPQISYQTGLPKYQPSQISHYGTGYRSATDNMAVTAHFGTQFPKPTNHFTYNPPTLNDDFYSPSPIQPSTGDFLKKIDEALEKSRFHNPL